MVILGMGALRRADGQAVMALARQIAEDTGMITEGWNGFNMLHTAASRVAGLDMGFVPGKGGKDVAAILKSAAKAEMKLVWLLGADEVDMSVLSDSFVIYQGHHGDAGAAGGSLRVHMCRLRAVLQLVPHFRRELRPASRHDVGHRLAH